VNRLISHVECAALQNFVESRATTAKNTGVQRRVKWMFCVSYRDFQALSKENYIKDVQNNYFPLTDLKEWIL
jgi:hypothetical protein